MQEQVAVLQVTMFGGLRVQSKYGVLDEKSIHSDMLTKLLAYILCHRKQNIVGQELAEVLWPEEGSDNPIGALKNLIYRLRKQMNKTLGKSDFIITGRGFYCWNEAIKVETDMEGMQELYREAMRGEMSRKQKIAQYEKVLELYQGSFLHKFATEYWVVSIATYYHSMYLNASERLAELLCEERSYQEAESVCAAALQVDSFDEELHGCFMKALMAEGKKNLAMGHYQSAAKLLYQNLGVRPSKKLRGIYTELQKAEREEEVYEH